MRKAFFGKHFLLHREEVLICIGADSDPDSPGTMNINRSFGLKAINLGQNVNTINNFMAES